MILLTPRMMLRRARPDDLAGLHRVLSHPAAMRYWSTPEHETLAQTQAFLADTIAAGAAGQSDEFLLEYDGQVIGKAGSWRLPEIGYILHTDHWRKGLMDEALRAVIPHLFARHGMDALTAEIDPRNAASQKLLMKMGFRETHRAERTLQWRDEWCDSIYYALRSPT